MLQTVVDYRLDVIGFNVLLLAVVLVIHRRLLKQHGQGLRRRCWTMLAALLVAGIVAPELAGRYERNELRTMIEGIAPTYAQELQIKGHARLALNTPADDPHYLALIEAQKRWQNVNKNVSDIYTLRKRADGTLVLLLDAETDYNRDGRYEGPREQRTAIGEAYHHVTPMMLRAFDGEPGFDSVPDTDRWGTWVSAYVPLYDANGRVEAVLGVDYDARAWTLAIARNRVAALGAVLLLSVILMSSAFVVVITRAELTKRTKAEREREVLQEQLLLTSRQAGMAEVATSVLHNVGNVLNSVNISTALLAEKVTASKAPALLKATALIRDNRHCLAEYMTADERGKVLPEYLIRLAELLAAENESMAGELALLERSVEHIKQIVAAQQNLARYATEDETFNIADVLEDAIRINALSLERHNIQLKRQIEPCAPFTGDRHKLLQVIVNLISNARHAVNDNTTPRQIVIGLQQLESSHGQPAARITVTDNGHGIAHDLLKKIFTHGFTTRADGHGFGLHYSAIAVQQLKGNLHAESQGIGHGATFVVELPVATAEVTPCN